MMRSMVVALLCAIAPASAFAYSFLDCLDLGVPRQACVGAVIGLTPNSAMARRALEAVIVRHLRANAWPYGALPDHL